MTNQKFVPESCCIFSENMNQYLNVFNCQSPQFGPPRTSDMTSARNDALHYKVGFRVTEIKKIRIMVLISFSTSVVC